MFKLKLSIPKSEDYNLLAKGECYRMSEFNIVREIGGVDTRDPSRLYTPEEQKAVLDYVFGDTGPQGEGIMLPSEQELYVGCRNTSTKYSIGRGSGIYHGLPALFVPKAGERVLFVAQNGGGMDGNGLDTFEGFLPTSVGQLLSLGKHYMRESVEGRRIDFRLKATPEHTEARDYLTQWIIGDALIIDPEDDIDEEDAEGLGVGIADFLGEELAMQEMMRIQEHDGGIFEKYIIELIGRLSDVRSAE